MAVSMLKVQPISHSADIAHEKYQSLLSPYAAAHVVKQLDSAERVSFREGTTSHTCHCVFFTAMSLPCKHIFKVRKEEGLDLYDETLCASRWLLQHNWETSRLHSNDMVARESESVLLTVTSAKRRILSHNEKFSKASIIGNQLASLTAEVSQARFEARLNLLS